LQRSSASGKLKAKFSGAPLFLILSIVLGCLILFYFFNLSTEQSYKKQIVSEQQKINSIEKNMEAQKILYEQVILQKKDIQEKITYAQNKLLLLQQIEKNKLDLYDIMKIVAEVAPNDLWLTKINLDQKGKMVIDGITFDNNKISEFMSSLDEKKYFKNTTFNFTQRMKLEENPAFNFEVVTKLFDSEEEK